VSLSSGKRAEIEIEIEIEIEGMPRAMNASRVVTWMVALSFVARGSRF